MAKKGTGGKGGGKGGKGYVFMGALKRYINVMKSNLTGPFPAFHMRNALSGLFNNAMLGLTLRGHHGDTSRPAIPPRSEQSNE